MASPVKQSYQEHVIEYLLGRVSMEGLQTMLTDEEVWEAVVAEAKLFRQEADERGDHLMMLTEDGRDADEDDVQDRQRFLDEFPRMKMELEERIRKLHALADRVDKVHKDCTNSQVVTGYMGVASGFLNILGFALAPVTAEVSLGLSATGKGLGMTAAVTSAVTRFVDMSTKLSAKAEASSLLSTKMDATKLANDVPAEAKPQVVSLTKNCFQDLSDIEKIMDAMSLAKDKPHLVARAKRLMTTGKISARSTKKVQKAFGGTALAMTKGARVMGAATAGVSLLTDVMNLIQESTHLHLGAKTESAEELRQKAQELERRLGELIQIWESLQ